MNEQTTQHERNLTITSEETCIRLRVSNIQTSRSGRNRVLKCESCENTIPSVSVVVINEPRLVNFLEMPLRYYLMFYLLYKHHSVLTCFLFDNLGCGNVSVSGIGKLPEAEIQQAKTTSTDFHHRMAILNVEYPVRSNVVREDRIATQHVS